MPDSLNSMKLLRSYSSFQILLSRGQDHHIWAYYNIIIAYFQLKKLLGTNTEDKGRFSVKIF